MVPATHYRVYYAVLLVVARSVIARWIVVNMTEHMHLVRFGRPKGVTPYIMYVMWMIFLLV